MLSRTFFRSGDTYEARGAWSVGGGAGRRRAGGERLRPCRAVRRGISGSTRRGWGPGASEEMLGMKGAPAAMPRREARQQRMSISAWGLAIALASSLLPLFAQAQRGHVRSDPQRRVGAAELADLQRDVLQPALQPAHAGHAGQRDEPRVEVGPAERSLRRLAVEPDRRRRDHVRHPAAQRRDGARCADGPRLLAVPPHAGARRARLLRRQQSRRRDPGRHACTWARSTRI